MLGPRLDGPDQLKKQSTFAELPVSRADHGHPWKFTSVDCLSVTSHKRELAGGLTADRKVT